VDGDVIYGLATYISADERGNFLEDEGVRDACLQVTTVQGVEVFWRVSDLLAERSRSVSWSSPTSPPTSARNTCCATALEADKLAEEALQSITLDPIREGDSQEGARFHRRLDYSQLAQILTGEGRGRMIQE